MIWLAILFVFVSAYNEFSFYSLFPFITENFEGNNGWKDGSIVYLFLILNVIHNIGRIVGFSIWKYSEIKLKTKHLVTICFGLSSIVYIFYGLSTNIYMLAVARFLIGMIYSNDEIMKKYLKESCKTTEVNMYTIIMAIVGKIGSIIGLLLGSYLYTYRFPNTDKFPLLTIGIVSSIISFLIFVINCIHAKKLININCKLSCCNRADQNQMVTYYSDDSEDEIRVRNHDRNNREPLDEPIETPNVYEFIISVVSFSSVHNMYRFIMVVYLFFNKYDIKNIGNIMAITEASGLIFGALLGYISDHVSNEHMYYFTHFVLIGIVSFFPFIMQITDYLSTLQIGVIILINCIAEISFCIILTFNNSVLKKHRSNNTKWAIYSMSTIFTNVISILFVSGITPLIKYTNENEYKKYVIDKHTPFYVTSLLFGFSLVYFAYNSKKINLID
jgi:hypothetical protein